MRKLTLILAITFAALGGSIALAATKPPPKSGSKPPTATYGLTQALAALTSCPSARFENDNVIALGGVLLENRARVDASPVATRMDFMTQLVAEETAKATDFAKAHKIDCSKAPELAAAYWNRVIARMAAEQKADETAASLTRGAAPRQHEAVPSPRTLGVARGPKAVTPSGTVQMP